jgi:BirA family biotin operon repressor/biotin-[acetyl-CoA-carboxylase] ligase
MNQIISLLLNQENYLSGQELARKLNLSRTAVWKQIHKAKEAGWKIESCRKKGYKIISSPKNRIIHEIVEFYFKNKLPFELILLESADSTNEAAKRMLLSNKEGSFLVTAEEQTAGKGRFHRKWESQKGKDLTFSLCLSLDKNISELYSFTMIAALSVYEVIASYLNDQSALLKIKWPNDIYYDGKKFCGILAETFAEDNIIHHIIIGIGININSSPTMETAISLKSILGKEADRNQILSEIMRKLQENLLSYQQGKFEAVYKKWKAAVLWIGKPVKLLVGQEAHYGILTDIQPNGALLISDSGKESVFYSGDLSADFLL